MISATARRKDGGVENEIERRASHEKGAGTARLRTGGREIDTHGYGRMIKRGRAVEWSTRWDEEEDERESERGRVEDERAIASRWEGRRSCLGVE